MKIAFFLTEFPCLSQTFILNQITGLLDRGHEVEIFADKPSDEPQVHDDVIKYKLMSRTCFHRGKLDDMPKSKLYRTIKAAVYILRYMPKLPLSVLNTLNIFKYGRKAASFKLLFQMLPLFDKGPYDIIHCHFGPCGNFALYLKSLRAIRGKLITSLHGYDMSNYIQVHGKEVYNDLFTKGDLFLPISERWRGDLIKLGCKEDKIIVHRMGIDINKFPFRSTVPLSNDNFNILTIGRLVEKKGVEYGIRAVAKIITEFPGVQYKIVGDGPLKESLLMLLQALNLEKNVELLGWKKQDEISKLMGWADILLAPSVTSSDGDQEGIPVVLMEASARGLPVVSSYHTGIPEIVRDRITGFLCPERDVDELASKLKDLITMPELRQEMGLAARKHAEVHHNIENLNDRLVEIYRGLIT